MALCAAAEVVAGKLEGEDREFTGVSIDSRTLAEGDLFVAIAGERFDGHDYIEAAGRAGAAGAVVSAHVGARAIADGGASLPLVRVPDTRRALAQLAAGWRRRFDLPVVAITGSNGKTTVKEMTAAIVARSGPGLVTAGNLNNEIGLPLTLLKLRAGHRYAVLELGMNHAGEIAYLATLCRPTVSLITNAAPAHLEGLGSVEAVARAKGELIESLPGDGVAIINVDDPHARMWRDLAGQRRVVTFGLEHEAQVSAAWERDDMGVRVHLRTPRGEQDLSLSVAGRHNVMNALAATAAALEAGAELAHVKAGLEGFAGVAGRGQSHTTAGGVCVIDDTYNANPGSLAAALEVLGLASGRRVLVLGDMGELGEAGLELHRQAGAAARAAGVALMIGVGELAACAVDAYGEGGVRAGDHDQALDVLRARLVPGDTVLVKGSRRMHMEDIVRALDDNGIRRGNGSAVRTE